MPIQFAIQHPGRPRSLGRAIEVSDTDRTYVKSVALDRLPQPGEVLPVVSAFGRYAPRTPGVAAPPQLVRIDYSPSSRHWVVEVHPFSTRYYGDNAEPVPAHRDVTIRLHAHDDDGQPVNEYLDAKVYLASSGIAWDVATVGAEAQA